MIKRFLVYSFVFFISILLLIFYNYQKTQKSLREAGQTVFSISWQNFSDHVNVNEPVEVSWKVSAPDSFSTTKTGIFWNYESSPSALTKNDSPLAVGYPNFTGDYSSGLFRLPDTFALRINFPHEGTVYLRAYALVGGDHLWTDERHITVSSPVHK